MTLVDPSGAPLSGGISALARYNAEKLLDDYKFTPGTLAYKLENRMVQPGGRLKWMPSSHLMFISLKIAKGIARGGARIIISAPPRHGKSRISTVNTPIWVLEKFPNLNVVLATYGQDLSSDFGREVRDTIQDCTHLLDVRIRDDVARTAKFLTNKGGAMTSVGLGGPITGRGANVLIIDDYIKEIKEALSPAYRDYLWDWFVTTAMTRLEPEASVIVVATRWHDDDLIGRIVKKFPNQWEFIKLHSIARENDVLNRKVGEALFPERYPIHVLLERRELLGSPFFDAIYDQEPHPEGGVVGKKEWLTTVDELPRGANLRFLRVWDLAGTPGGGDPTCGGLFAHDQDTNEIYICNIIRRHLGPKGVEELVQSTAENDGTGVPIVIEREPGSSGKTVVNHYQTTVLPEYTVEESYSNDHKLVKAQPFLAAAEAGKIKLIKGHWNEAYIQEFGEFGDGAKHDDQVDISGIAFVKLRGKRKMKATFGRRSRLNRAKTQQEKDKIMAGTKVDQTYYEKKKGLGTASIRKATFGRRKSQRRS